jgi:hypothetical protein
MKWFVVKTFLKKAWLKAKKYWWAIVLGLGFLTAALIGALTRNGAYLAALLDLMESKDAAHNDEMETLDRIHSTEVEEKNKRLAEHQKRMLELEKEFEARNETLDKKKRAELKKLVDEGYNDPEKLTKEIAVAFGLRYG